MQAFDPEIRWHISPAGGRLCKVTPLWVGMRL